MIHIHNNQGNMVQSKLGMSPLFKRTSQLNQSQEWRRWAGYLAAAQYDMNHENEYFAIRTKAALLDISPLYKYLIRGTDAQRFLDRLVTRNIQICKVGQKVYCGLPYAYGGIYINCSSDVPSANECTLRSNTRI